MSESNFLKGRNWAYLLIGTSPSVKFRLLRRCFGSLGKYDIQVGIGLIEELFEIEVIHQHNPHDCGQS